MKACSRPAPSDAAVADTGEAMAEEEYPMRRIFGFLFVLAVLSCGVAQSMYSVSLMAQRGTAVEQPVRPLSSLVSGVFSFHKG